MIEYEALLADHGTDYRNVGAHGVDAETRERLFGPGRGNFRCQPGHEEMLIASDELFRRHEKNGEVVLRYRTEVYHGALHR